MIKQHYNKHYLKYRERLIEYQKKYYQLNRKRILAKQKDYKRTHVIRYRRDGHTADIYGVNKRPYPKDNKCECCKGIFRLTYHHNDDKDYEHGIWLCRNCHLLVEAAIKNPNLIKVAMEYSYNQKKFNIRI